MQNGFRAEAVELPSQDISGIFPACSNGGPTPAHARPALVVVHPNE